MVSALKADALSLVVFEIGMFAWMAVSYYVLFSPPLKANQMTFWLMRQIAMLVGMASSYPMNRWLLKKGIKEKM